MAEGKRRKRELNGLRVVMILVVIGLLIGIGLVVKNIISLSLEKRALEKQNSDLTNKRDELTTELENVNDTDYIEEQARKLLHMIKPGEVLYIISNGGLNKTDSDGSSDVPLPEQQGGNQGNGEEEAVADEAGGEENGEEYSEEQGGSEESSYEYSEEGSAEYSEEGCAEYSEESAEEVSEGSEETSEADGE